MLHPCSVRKVAVPFSTSSFARISPTSCVKRRKAAAFTNCKDVSNSITHRNIIIRWASSETSNILLIIAVFILGYIKYTKISIGYSSSILRIFCNPCRIFYNGKNLQKLMPTLICRLPLKTANLSMVS